MLCFLRRLIKPLTGYDSACGIPDNSCDQGKAAIHPYWLKYAGLDRKYLLINRSITTLW